MKGVPFETLEVEFSAHRCVPERMDIVYRTLDSRIFREEFRVSLFAAERWQVSSNRSEGIDRSPSASRKILYYDAREGKRRMSSPDVTEPVPLIEVHYWQVQRYPG